MRDRSAPSTPDPQRGSNSNLCIRCAAPLIDGVDCCASTRPPQRRSARVRPTTRNLRTDCATAVNLILDSTAPWVDYDMIPNWLYDPILDTV